MVEKLIAVALKKYGLDKYVSNVKVNPAVSSYKLTLNNGSKSVTLGFDIHPEYRDEVELLLELLG